MQEVRRKALKRMSEGFLAMVRICCYSVLVSPLLITNITTIALHGRRDTPEACFLITWCVPADFLGHVGDMHWQSPTHMLASMMLVPSKHQSLGLSTTGIFMTATHILQAPGHVRNLYR